MGKGGGLGIGLEGETKVTVKYGLVMDFCS